MKYFLSIINCVGLVHNLYIDVGQGKNMYTPL